MTNKQLELDGKPDVDTRENQMLVKDVVQHLSGLAKLYQEEKIGNPALSQGLRQVVKALRPYAACPVQELAGTLKETKLAKGRNTPPRKKKATLPSNLESVCKEDIERILGDENYTKGQVAELGFKRFGVSRSTLERLRKEDAVRSVRIALEHEKSLDVISQQARKSGKDRAL